MNDVPKIDSEESLAAWLEGRSREGIVYIAYRSVMRAVPVWGGDSDSIGQDYLNASLRTALNTHLMVEWSILSDKAAPQLTDSILWSTVETLLGVKIKGAVWLQTGVLIAALTRLAQLLSSPSSKHLDDGSFKLNMARVVAFASEGFDDGFEKDAFWTSAAFDLGWLDSDGRYMRRSLWSDATPACAAQWKSSTRALRNTPGRLFWIDWYQRILDGQPQNWDLLRDVALIDDTLWREGGEALDRRINDIRREHALAATANGERIELNPETGKLRLVPDSALPEDIAAYARRKIIKAVEIFDDEDGQLYGGLAKDLAMLRRTVTDAGNMPVELFDACSSAVTRLSVRISTGDCPSIEQDPLIADYRNRLRDAAADILGSDPETRKVLTRRAAITGNDALIEAADEIRELVVADAVLIEGRLAEMLPADAKVATDPNAPADLRADASFRLAGRLLRIESAKQAGKDVWKGFWGTVKAVGTTGGFYRALEALYRYLGL